MSPPNRPAGAPCIRCHVKPARLNKLHQHLATNYCSDQCRDAHQRIRRTADEAQLCGELRALLGVPGNRGPRLTLPELRLMVRHLKRAVPGELMRSTRRRRRTQIQGGRGLDVPKQEGAA